jgi:drug/metabolite transporter (DMT)-like permease
MSTQATTRATASLVLPIAAIVVGVVLVLLAQFTLDSLADTSDTWHNIQHGAFFVGGIAVGLGGTLLWASGRRA